MAYTEKDIVYEGKRFWVLDASPTTYEVLRNDVTHSTRVATVGKGLPDAKERAIAECKRRETPTRLYALHLSRHVKGMVKGPVRTQPPAGALFDIAPSGDMVVPCKDAVRACLPACYRKAFDRAGLSQISGQSGFHWTLRDVRGRYINTVYAIPRDV